MAPTKTLIKTISPEDLCVHVKGQQFETVDQSLRFEVAHLRRGACLMFEVYQRVYGMRVDMDHVSMYRAGLKSPTLSIGLHILDQLPISDLAR